MAGRIVIEPTEEDTIVVLERLALRYGVPTGDVIRIALGVLSDVTNEIDHGSVLKFDRGGELVEVVVRGLERLCPDKESE
jgi:hypothetical protein